MHKKFHIDLKSRCKGNYAGIYSEGMGVTDPQTRIFLRLNISPLRGFASQTKNRLKYIDIYIQPASCNHMAYPLEKITTV